MKKGMQVKEKIMMNKTNYFWRKTHRYIKLKRIPLNLQIRKHTIEGNNQSRSLQHPVGNGSTQQQVSGGHIKPHLY